MPDPERLLRELQSMLAESVKLSDCQLPREHLPTIDIDAGLGVSLGPVAAEIRQAVNSMEGIEKPQIKFSLNGLSGTHLRDATARRRPRPNRRRGRGRWNVRPSF